MVGLHPVKSIADTNHKVWDRRYSLWGADDFDYFLTLL